MRASPDPRKSEEGAWRLPWGTWRGLRGDYGVTLGRLMGLGGIHRKSHVAFPFVESKVPNVELSLGKRLPAVLPHRVSGRDCACIASCAYRNT